MTKILSLDYGAKKTGIAITDESKTFAFGVGTVKTQELFSYLTQLFKEETIELVIIGEPKQMNGLPSESEVFIQEFLTKFKITFSKTPTRRVDERFTSKLAFNAMISGGLKKKQRQNKEKIDEISAVIILQTYLENIDLQYET